MTCRRIKAWIAMMIMVWWMGFSKCHICNLLQIKCPFFKYPMPENTQWFWKYSGLGTGIAKNDQVGYRVPGNRQTLIMIIIIQNSKNCWNWKTNKSLPTVQPFAELSLAAVENPLTPALSPPWMLLLPRWWWWWAFYHIMIITCQRWQVRY